MNKFFTEDDMDTLIFYQVPKVLILGEQYKKLNPNAFKLYVVLLDRIKLSMKNGWKEDNKFFVTMSQENATEIFGVSPTTFRAMKKELEKYDLLEQKREGQGKVNKLFIKKCDYSEEDVYRINEETDRRIIQDSEKGHDNHESVSEENLNEILSESSNPEDNKNEEIEQKMNEFRSINSYNNSFNFKKNKNCSSHGAEGFEQKDRNCSSRKTEVVHLEGQKLATNNNNLNNNNLNNNNGIIVNNLLTKKVSKNRLIELDKISLKLKKEYAMKGLSNFVIDKVIQEVLEKEHDIKNFGGYLRACLENCINHRIGAEKFKNTFGK